jgi:filamentous hemagglutinin family protein
MNEARDKPKDIMNRNHASARNEKAHFPLKGTVLALMAAFAPGAIALPTGGAVSAGTATIAATPGNTTINQSSQNVAINWQSFGIAAGEAVKFVQPSSSSIALNRVLGSDASSILGSLSANGKVFLVNPNGILFGKGAQVNVAGLVASTLNISDADFMAGRYKFSGGGSGSIVNQGSINADGGYVALLGAKVNNEGVISASLGTVALVGGNAVTLDVAGDGLLNVTVDQGAVDALVSNGGLIRANGGQVLMSASAAGNLLRTVVNNTGVIEAQTLENRNGTIRLLGDMQSGTVNVGGTLDASAPNGGNGGFIDTSAAHVKILDGARITTASAHGSTGNWLIDPVDYTIAAANGDITGAQLSANLLNSNVTIMSSAGAVGVNGDINVSDIVSWSQNRLTLNAFRNININSAMNGSGSASLALQYGQGAVTSGNTSTYNVLAPVNLPAGNNFSTMLGFNGATVNYTVITTLGAAGSATTTDLQGMQGNLSGHYALGANIDATATAGWNGGFGFDPIGKIAGPTNFTGNFDGLGHTISGLTILRPLQSNIGLFGFVVSTGGAMLKNVTLSGGSVRGGDYVGNLVGHLTGDISNSHATQAVRGDTAPDTYVGGLAGWVTGNVINSSSTGAVTGAGSYVGGLLGWITGNITCCFATGPVTTAGGFVGGLAGWVTGNVSRSYATGTVNTQAGDVGGLIGWITGDVSNSFAQGNVATAGGNVGGLLGWKTGNISNTYSSGSVAGAVPVGGLIGADLGGITTNSFWDTTTSLQGLSAGGAGVKGMTTAQMKTQANFTSATPANAPLSPSWDFVNIWTMTEAVTYPTLLACLAPTAFTPVPFVPPVIIAAVVAPVVVAPVLDLVAAVIPPEVVVGAVLDTDVLVTAFDDVVLPTTFDVQDTAASVGTRGLNLTVVNADQPPMRFAATTPPPQPVAVVPAPVVVTPRAVEPVPIVVPPPPPPFVPVMRPPRQDRH